MISGQNLTAALLVMAKRPSPGLTKSRLSPPLTSGAAAGLYRAFLLDALDLARSVPEVQRVIAYAPLDARKYFEELAPDFDLVPQIGASLGERLDYVLSRTLERGFRQVVAMNSDSPNLPLEILNQAFEKLTTAEIDLVLGPCVDGGYYLIGWKRPHPELVRGVRMSTSEVLRETLALASKNNLCVGLLPDWYDIDEAPDLDRLWAGLRRDPSGSIHTLTYLEKLSTELGHIPWRRSPNENAGASSLEIGAN